LLNLTSAVFNRFLGEVKSHPSTDARHWKVQKGDVRWDTAALIQLLKSSCDLAHPEAAKMLLPRSPSFVQKQSDDGGHQRCNGYNGCDPKQ
jgi:hypothetical protein